MLSAVLHFLLDNGIGQNITAGLIVAPPAAAWARVKLWKPWREHHERVKQLHAHLMQHRPGPPAEGLDDYPLFRGR